MLLARDRDGIGRAFHNVCPYDGCEAVLSPLSDIDEIVTPYHGWRYALDGRLLQAPYWDGTADAARLDVADLNADLVPIDCAEWFGTVFLRLTAEGGSFDRYLQPVSDYCADLDLKGLAPGHDEHGQPRIDRLTISSNWKTVYENYAPNVYHEGFVHAMYRRSPHTPRVKDGRKTYREVIGENGFIGLDYVTPCVWSTCCVSSLSSIAGRRRIMIMARRRHTPEQIVRKLREADRLLAEGAGIADVARHLEVSEQTFHRWRNQYGAMKADDVKRLKALDNRVGGSFYPDSPFRPIQDRAGKPSRRNAIINMFPNWALTVLNQYARVTINQPVAVDRCEQSIVTFFDGDQASDPELVAHPSRIRRPMGEKQRNRAARGGVVAREEDNAIVESIQRARRSPAFDSHFYSHFWDRPHYTLSNLLADRIEAAQANRS